MTIGKFLCRICGHTKGHTPYTVREMMFGRRELFTYFQCAACQCLQIEAVPENLASHYPADYYSYQDHGGHGLKRLLIQIRNRAALTGKGLLGGILARRYPHPALQSLRRLRLPKTARILDVSCGRGDLIYNLFQLGYEHVLGIDPYLEKDLRYPNGTSVLKKSLGEMEGSFDVIMFHHSFEHVPDQHDTLVNTLRLLANDGVCLIRMPVVNSSAWKKYGVNWVQIDAPRHLFLHTPQSLRLAGEKAGLRLTDIVFDSDAFQFWGSEQYARDMPLMDKRSFAVNKRIGLFSRKEMKKFKRQAAVLNETGEGDQAAFYFRHV